jgi:hypothetical protein
VLWDDSALVARVRCKLWNEVGDFFAHFALDELSQNRSFLETKHIFTVKIYESLLRLKLLRLKGVVTMDEQTYIITFDTASAADANRYAEELRQALLDASPDVEVRRKRDDPHAQDFGGTLVLVLGTPAAVAVVTAMSNWLARRYQASITIKKADEQIVVQNITSKRADELARLFLGKRQGND